MLCTACAYYTELNTKLRNTPTRKNSMDAAAHTLSLLLTQMAAVIELIMTHRVTDLMVLGCAVNPVSILCKCITSIPLLPRANLKDSQLFNRQN